MAYSAGALDNTTHAVQAILQISGGTTALKVKFPKVKPAGGGDVSDAAWQARMQTEVLNAHNATMSGNLPNATPLLANLV